MFIIAAKGRTAGSEEALGQGTGTVPRTALLLVAPGDVYLLLHRSENKLFLLLSAQPPSLRVLFSSDSRDGLASQCPNSNILQKSDWLILD